MLKRLLLSSFAIIAISFTTSSVYAENIIRDDILKLAYCNFNDDEMFVRIPCKNITPCLMTQLPKICAEPCKQKLPCDPCNKPKAGWTQGCHCDKEIKKLHEFLSKADCIVGLTPEQKQNADLIRKGATREIIELKREIATKESEILGLKNSANCYSDNAKEINKLNNEVNKMNKNVEKICKNAKNEYKSMLNSTQKRIFNNYKKQWTNNPDIANVQVNPCPCNK